MSDKITSHELLEAGIPGGAYFPNLLAQGNALLAQKEDAPKERGDVIAHLKNLYESDYKPHHIPLSKNPPTLKINIEAENEREQKNIDYCRASMEEAAKTPTVRALSIMPDACPAGALGTITVGGVIAAENALHPGMHSADICCSMTATNLGKIDPKSLLECASTHVRFGPHGKNDLGLELPASLLKRFEENRFMRDEAILEKAHKQLGTQGDGNHFYFVGLSEKTGDTYLISHHGSRGVGGILYAMGMKQAKKHTMRVCPEALPQNSWIEASSKIGQDYWEALQLAREWTKLNHSLLHDYIAKELHITPQDRFWNEHNFVFKRDNLYYHAKGATPAWDGFAEDNDPHGRTIIPLNMSQPILIVKGADNPNALGFAPHGAGRNLSRTGHRATLGERPIEEIFAEETKNIDARFQSGKIDVTELPSAYKNADSVTKQIERLNLAKLEDRILPYGTIMAGDLGYTRKRKEKKKEAEA